MPFYLNQQFRQNLPGMFTPQGSPQTMAQGLGVSNPYSGLGAQPGYTPTPKGTLGANAVGNTAGAQTVPLEWMASGPTMTPTSGVTTSSYPTQQQPTLSTGQNTFSPQSNLIGAQFNPTPSTRLQNFQNTADQAMSSYNTLGSSQNIDALRAGMQSGLTSAQAAQAFKYSPLSMTQGIGASLPSGFGQQGNELRKMTMDDLAKVREGSDRGKIAGDVYDILAERSQPDFDKRVRELGQKTAALGRIGSGIYGSNLTDINTERERELGLNRRELSAEAADKSLGDRLDILGATRGVMGDIGSADASMASALGAADRDAYNRNAAERDFAFDVARYNNDLAFRRGDFEQGTAGSIFGSEGQYDDRRFDQARSRAGDTATYADQIRRGEASDRDELRGERSWQYGLERDAQDDRYRSRAFEEDLVDRGFDRDIRQRTVEDALFGNQYDRGLRAYELGTRNNVAGQLNRQSQRYDQQAQDAGDAFAEMMASYGLRTQPPGSPTEEYYRKTGRYPVDDLRIPSTQVRY